MCNVLEYKDSKVVYKRYINEGCFLYSAHPVLFTPVTEEVYVASYPGSN